MTLAAMSCCGFSSASKKSRPKSCPPVNKTKIQSSGEKGIGAVVFQEYLYSFKYRSRKVSFLAPFSFFFGYSYKPASYAFLTVIFNIIVFQSPVGGAKDGKPRF